MHLPYARYDSRGKEYVIGNQSEQLLLPGETYYQQRDKQDDFRWHEILDRLENMKSLEQKEI